MPVNKKLAPIALFCYNRPKHLIQTLEALSQNYLAKESLLYIFCDGPKKNSSEIILDQIKKVRLIASQKNWCGETVLLKTSTNKGLAQSIINGVTEVVNKHGKIIVLEDDHYTSPFFLSFMNKALEYYEFEEKVISIHGYTYPIKNLPPQYFLKGADCWGWATWKRGWNLFETDGKKLLDEIIAKKLSNEFNFNNSYAYTKMLKKQVNGENSSWAIRWYASAFLKNKLTLYPGISYIKNIGLDGSGTHSKTETEFNSKTLNNSSNIENIKIEENILTKKKISLWFRQRRYISILQRLNPFSNFITK